MLAIVLFVKARGENQYVVTEYSVNSLVFFFFRFSSDLFFQTVLYYMANCTYDSTSVVAILTLCLYKV